jgi:hypothetical protein
MFALPERIESYATDVLRQLADERHLRELARERFAAVGRELRQRHHDSG